MSKFFNVIVEITGTISYVIEAENEAAAGQAAIAMADKCTRLSELDVSSTHVANIADETEEHV